MNMRFLLLRLAIAFSVIMAGIHTPASAHSEVKADIALHHDHHLDHAANMSDSNEKAPAEGSSTAMHHHHCPIGLNPAPFAALTAMVPRQLVPSSCSAAVMRSRATAPPLHPPSA
jgi:hypothetical protein